MKRPPGMRFALCCVGLVVSGCRCADPERPRDPLPATSAVAAGSTVLATLPEELSPDQEFFFGERGGVAYVAQKGSGFQVVRDGRGGDVYEAVGAIALGPDGRRVAHGALVGGKWRMVVDGEAGAAFDVVEAPVFSPDGSHVAYQARAGESWHLVVDAKISAGSRARFESPQFCGGSTRIAYIAEADAEGRGKLVLGDLAFEKHTVVDPHVSRFQASEDGSRIAAVSEGEGGQQVVTLACDASGRVERAPARDAVYAVALAPDGRSLAYLAERAGERFVVLNGKTEPLPPGEQPVETPVVRPDGSGVGIFVVTGDRVNLRQFFRDQGKGDGAYRSLEGLTYSSDGRSLAYAAETVGGWLVVANGKEGPSFDRVVTPAFSPDGRFLVYRARKDGKRFVVVADTDGKTIRRHPSYEQVFPVRFTADGKSIAYGVKDGRQLAWKVEPL